MENIIVKSLEELGILLKGIIEIIKKKKKTSKKRDFSQCYYGN